MKKKIWSTVTIILGIIYPVIITVIFASLDLSTTWASWNSENPPDFWNYTLLIFFKLSLYFFPALIVSVGLRIDDKKNILKKKLLYYYLIAQSYWFLALTCIKFTTNTVFELDRIFGITIFNSLNEIETLIGSFATLILRRNIKFNELAKDDDLIEISK